MDDEPDKARQHEEGRKQDERTNRLRDDGPRATDGGSVCEIGVARHDSYVTVNAGAFTEIDVAHKNRGVPGDGVSRFDGNGAESDGHISRNFSPNVDGAESTGNIGDDLSLGNRNIGTEAGAIVVSVGALRKGR